MNFSGSVLDSVKGRAIDASLVASFMNNSSHNLCCSRPDSAFKMQKRGPKHRHFCCCFALKPFFFQRRQWPLNARGQLVVHIITIILLNSIFIGYSV